MIPDHETSYADFLKSTNATPFEKLVAKSYVEGFNGAEANLISTAAVAIGDQAAARNNGQRQFRLATGYGSLIEWLATDLLPESLHLKHPRTGDSMETRSCRYLRRHSRRPPEILGP
jgi:hypothetical protein